MSYAIAIDGPAGAGKSSIARRMAEILDIIYVDTGALYRVIGLAVYREAGMCQDPETISRIADHVDVSLSHNEKGQRVFLGEEDVSEEIRREEISQMASIVSAVPFVREKLLSLQRDMAKNQSVVMDGRDIGTRILPNAEYKVFLVCPAEERARRRLLQLREQGLSGDYDQILADIKERDHRDMTREISPLVKADDAIEFDTTGHTAESSANELIEVLGLCPKSC